MYSCTYTPPASHRVRHRQTGPESLHPSMKSMSNLTNTYVQSWSPPVSKLSRGRGKCVGFGAGGCGGTRSIYIDYDSDYDSERVFIVCRATVIPDDGSPSFTVTPGDAFYSMVGFRCTWRIKESPLVLWSNATLTLALIARKSRMTSLRAMYVEHIECNPGQHG